MLRTVGFKYPDEIAVGIPTVGVPRLVSVGDGLTRLENMLIGKDFHWQQELSVVLPGRVVVRNEERVVRNGNGAVGGEEMGFGMGEVINYVPLERYLECVVGSEMNPGAPVEFLKAHAIISRSWAVGKVLGIHPEDDAGRVDTEGCLIGWDDTSAHTGFHVCSDDHCQRYQGVQPVAPEVLKAIRATAGMVLTDKEGKLIDARFSKCCGGVTELFSTCWQDKELAGLESFSDPWCNLYSERPYVAVGKNDRDNIPEGEEGHDSEGDGKSLPEVDVNTVGKSDGVVTKGGRAKASTILRTVLKEYDLSTKGGYRWTAFVSKSEIERNLREKFKRNVGRVLGIEAVERGLSGRIKLLRIVGDNGILLLGKELWIRRLLSPTHLYSSAFDIEDLGDEVKLTGRGWGHGVGLCQIGAARMAFEGARCEEILRFYYPGTRILPLW